MEYEIRRGQTALIRLEYTVNEEPLADFTADELEFTFGAEKYYLSDGGIYFNDEEQAYCVFITQEQSFALPLVVSYQLRILKDGEVAPSDIEYMSIGDSLSDVVLSVGSEVAV